MTVTVYSKSCRERRGSAEDANATCTSAAGSTWVITVDVLLDVIGIETVARNGRGLAERASGRLLAPPPGNSRCALTARSPRFASTCPPEYVRVRRIRGDERLAGDDRKSDADVVGRLGPVVGRGDRVSQVRPGQQRARASRYLHRQVGRGNDSRVDRDRFVGGRRVGFLARYTWPCRRWSRSAYSRSSGQRSSSSPSRPARSFPDCRSGSFPMFGSTKP